MANFVFVLILNPHTPGERLQDHWSSGFRGDVGRLPFDIVDLFSLEMYLLITCENHFIIDKLISPLRLLLLTRLSN